MSRKLTIERARKILGKAGNKYSDKEIERIVDFYTKLGTIVIDQALEKGQ